MDAPQQVNTLKQVRYADLLVRILMSTFVGYYVMRIGRFESVQTTIERKGYWVGFFFSVAVALVITTVVRKLFLKMDKKYPWENDFWKRFWLQVIYGIFGSFGVAFFLMALYYHFILHKFPLSWYDRYGAAAGWMIVGLNCYYTIYYLYCRFIANKENAALLEVVPSGMPSVDEVVRPIVEEVIEKKIEDPIELAVVRKGFLKMKYWKDRQESTSLSLDEISSGLSDLEYVIVNRAFTIRRSNVLDVLKKVNGRRVVLSKYPIGGRYEVSARQAHKFDWFKRNKT